MKWEKYTLITKTDAVDIISASLGDIGVEGIEIEDNVPLTAEETKGMFIDILPELPKDEGVAKVSFYLDSEADNTKLLEDIHNTLEELKEFCEPVPNAVPGSICIKVLYFASSGISSQVGFISISPT